MDEKYFHVIAHPENKNGCRRCGSTLFSTLFQINWVSGTRQLFHGTHTCLRFQRWNNLLPLGKYFPQHLTLLMFFLWGGLSEYEKISIWPILFSGREKQFLSSLDEICLFDFLGALNLRLKFRQVCRDLLARYCKYPPTKKQAESLKIL